MDPTAAKLLFHFGGGCPAASTLHSDGSENDRRKKTKGGAHREVFESQCKTHPVTSLVRPVNNESLARRRHPDKRFRRCSAAPFWVDRISYDFQRLGMRTPAIGIIAGLSFFRRNESR